VNAVNGRGRCAHAHFEGAAWLVPEPRVGTSVQTNGRVRHGIPAGGCDDHSMSSGRHPSRVAVRGPISLAAGAAVVAALSLTSSLPVGLLAGWATTAAINVVWLLCVVWPMDAEQTRSHTTAVDPGRPLARLIAVIGSVASLGGVVVVLVGSGSGASSGGGGHHVPAFVVAAVAIAGVVSSWALIQVDYMLRYAHVYFAREADGKSGGIDFNQEEPPTYSDFGYFAVGLGMTYQVSDNDVSANEIRRIVVAQTLLAYLFGAVILATVINLVAGLG